MSNLRPVEAPPARRPYRSPKVTTAALSGPAVLLACSPPNPFDCFKAGQSTYPCCASSNANCANQCP